MLRKNVLISMLIAVMSLGFAGSVFAGNADEAGNYQYKFGGKNKMQDFQAAEHYNYNQKQLAKVGTEAGNWAYNFNAPEPQNVEAAEAHPYNAKTLAKGRTESGNWNTPQNSQSQGVPPCNQC
jgi:hypothetical protein